MKKQNQETNHKNSYCLPAGTRLNQRYVLKKVLGEGGFGITYLGWDEVLAISVAVKEYYPSSMAGREIQGSNTYQVRAYGNRRREAYEKGKEAFLKEARVLSRFCKLEGIVLVRDFFQENGTAYIVMEYIDGISIKEYVQTKGAISAENVLQLMKPVLQSLYAIHGRNLIHRDLSPDNILMTKQGKLKLIDFGAARHTDTGTQKTVTVMFKRGFAALEQYQAKGEQGVWTDVYGISATMYYMMSGEVPEESVGRVLKDGLTELKAMQREDIPDDISASILKGMELEWEKRFQNLAELYQALYGEEIPKRVQEFEEQIVNEGDQFPMTNWISSASQQKIEKSVLETEILSKELALEMRNSKGSSMVKRWLLAIAVVVLLAGGGVAVYQEQQIQNEIDVKLKQQIKAEGQRHQQSDSLVQFENNVQESKQPIEKKMPNLIGEELVNAKKRLQELGVDNIQIKRQYSQKVKKGKVIRQNVPVGKVLTDIKVQLVVSKGRKAVAKNSTGKLPIATPVVSQESSEDSQQKEKVAGSLDDLLN